MSLTITLDKLLAISGQQAPTDVMHGLVEPLQRHMGAAGLLDSRLQTVHFLAQGCHETDRFNTLVEYGGRSYFEKYDPGTPVARRLGNTRPGDGWLFKGRGFLQTTGRFNYDAAGKAIGVDLIRQPDVAADPDIAVRIAVFYWTDRKCGQWAEADNVRMVTRLINGGTNGLAGRKAALDRAKLTYPADDRRSTAALQRALNRLGATPKLAVDGSMGPLTAEAVRKFQAARWLVTDGQAGPKTWAAIDDAIADLDV